MQVVRTPGALALGAGQHPRRPTCAGCVAALGSVSYKVGFVTMGGAGSKRVEVMEGTNGARGSIYLLLMTLLLTACSLISSAEPVMTPTGRAVAQPTGAVIDSGRPVPAPGFTPGLPVPSVTPAPSTAAPPTATLPVLSTTALPTPGAASVTPVPSPSPELPTPTPGWAEVVYSLPIGLPGRVPGDGFFVRHGYAVENTWYNPGYWHTGEDWYALQGDTARAAVYAVAAGEVVYVGANYPGRVVIVAHPDGLFSMYGHLDPAVVVQAGQSVGRGALLGTILRRGDAVPNHLHFEVRTFYVNREVNGAAPRYGFRCGVNCPPGPGYWPMTAPDHPSDLGWRNPTHVLTNRALAAAAGATFSEVVVVGEPISASLVLWSAPPAGGSLPFALGELAMQPGERYALLGAWTGAEDARGTSSLAYQVWYHLRLDDGREGWVQAAVPTSYETGSDGRPATVRFNLLPAVE